MSERSCGSCTACCEGWLTAEKLDMQPGRPCRHCTSRGCAIYADRPKDPCVSFVCGWLRPDSPLPGRMRPDRAGAIVLLGRKWRDWRVIYAVPTGQSVPEQVLEWLKAYAQRERTPLIFFEFRSENGTFDNRHATGFGPPAFVNAVKFGIGPEDVVRM